MYLRGQGIRRKIEYTCQSRGVNPKFEFLGGKNRGDIAYDGKRKVEIVYMAKAEENSVFFKSMDIPSNT